MLGRKPTRDQSIDLADLDDVTTAAEVAAAEELDVARDPVFALQTIERAIVRAALDVPDALTAEELRRVRYLLSFARLTAFEPGAAGPHGQRGRGDVDITADIAPWRERVVDRLRRPIREERDPARRLRTAHDALLELADEQAEIRARIVEKYANDFSAAELDLEVGFKRLVTVWGGGAGAGFVYIGAMYHLVDNDLVPDYIIGSSMGAVLGSVFAREKPVPMEDYVAFARQITYRSILGPEPRQRRHGLTSAMSLRFDEYAADIFRRPDGRQMRMDDLAIPFDSVVAGVHQQLFKQLPAGFRRQELASLRMRALPVIPIGLGPIVSSRLWQVGSFIDARIVKPIVIGGDALTGAFNVVDAASFSAAIPGVLHHEAKEPRMWDLLDELLRVKGVAALVDGGAASNVPVELAWRRVQDGRLGTRNAMYLAMDCFHPQWDPKHLWLTPITRAVQVQMVRNAPYADQLIRMSPTLAPTNLAPNEGALKAAIGWGRASLDAATPFMRKMLEPVWWEGEAPPQPGVPHHVRTPIAPSIKPVLEAAERSREAMKKSTAAFRKWRDTNFS
jgi:predicted acylesterase/phospholipase RssA